MEEVNTIGLDIAKSVFQAHGADAAGYLSSAFSSVVVTQDDRHVVTAEFDQVAQEPFGLDKLVLRHLTDDIRLECLANRKNLDQLVTPRSS